MATIHLCLPTAGVLHLRCPCIAAQTRRRSTASDQQRLQRTNGARRQAAACSAWKDRRREADSGSSLICLIKWAFAEAIQPLLQYLRKVLAQIFHRQQSVSASAPLDGGWVLGAAAAQVQRSPSSPAVPRWVILAAVAAACLAAAAFLTKPKQASGPLKQPSAVERMQTGIASSSSGSQKTLQTAAMGQPSPPAQAPRLSAEQADDKREAAGQAGQAQAASTVMPDPGSQLSRAALGQPSTSELDPAARSGTAGRPGAAPAAGQAASRAAPQQKRDLTPRPFFATSATPPQQGQPASAQTAAPQQPRASTPKPFSPPPAAEARQAPSAARRAAAPQQKRELTPKPFFASPAPPPQQAWSASPQTAPPQQQRDLTPKAFFASPAPSPAPAQPVSEQRLAAQQQRDLAPKAFFASPSPSPAPAQPVSEQRPAAQQQRDLAPKAFYASPAPSPAPAQPVSEQRPAAQQQRDLAPKAFFASPAPPQQQAQSAPAPAPPSEQRRDLKSRPFFASPAPAAPASRAEARPQQPPPKSFSPFFGSQQAPGPAAVAVPKPQQGSAAGQGRPGQPAAPEADKQLPPPPPLAGHAEQAAALQSIHQDADADKGAAQGIASVQTTLPPVDKPSPARGAAPTGSSGAHMDDEAQADQRPQQPSSGREPAASSGIRQDDDMSGSNAPQDADPTLPDTYAIGAASMDEGISPWDSVDGLVDDASDVSVQPVQAQEQQDPSFADGSLAEAAAQAQEDAMRMLAAGVSLPHPEKPDQRGEDAFFITRAGLGAAAVADGVGGWAQEGIDAGEFSRQLMQGSADAVEAAADERMDPVRALRAGHAGVQNVPGSCTACVAVMHPDGEMQIANLGDSGFRVFRDGKCVFASEAQQHAFNTPLQLGPRMEDGSQFDQPEDADKYKLQLEAGDVLILATDGILDNMWEKQMEQIVSRYMEATMGGAQAQGTLRRLAKQIARQAQKNARRPNFRSPWAVERAKAGYGGVVQRLRPVGGKMDDCTAVAALIHAMPPPWA